MSIAGDAVFGATVVLRGCWCCVMLVIFVVAYFGTCLPLLPAKYLWPRLWWWFEGKLYRWLMGSVGYWGYTAGYDIIEFGDDLSECCLDRAVVICNHQSTADVPALLLSLQQKGVAGRKTMWIMAGIFKWSPFGLIGQMHGDFFIWEGRATKELERLTEYLKQIFWARDRRWVILFPEGGFLSTRFESSQRYGRKNNYPLLKNVTLPRLGAFRAIMEAIGPRSDGPDSPIKLHPSKLELIKDTVGAIREKKYIKDTRPPVKYVLDITIGYKDGVALSADQLWFGTRRSCEDIHIYYKVYKASEVPFDDEDLLRTWMFDRFVEKDKMLEQYYATGEFMPGEYGRRLYFPLWKIMLQYLFWFGLTYGLLQVYSALLLRLLAAACALGAPILGLWPFTAHYLIDQFCQSRTA